MSARAAVFTLLTSDPTLNGLGINADSTWPTQVMDVAPRDRRFLLLRWEEITRPYQGRSTEVMTAWAHCPRELSTDYVPLLAILNRVTEILTSATHVPGSDGTLTCVDYNGMSADFHDEVYRTITKNAAYTVVSR